MKTLLFKRPSHLGWPKKVFVNKNRFGFYAFLALCMSSLVGCSVISIAGSAVGAAISVGGAVVSTGVTVTGKVVGAGIDAATGSATPDPVP